LYGTPLIAKDTMAVLTSNLLQVISLCFGAGDQNNRAP
jgi:hypothetical protein